MSCGIYIITNIINGKVYIGQSINVEKRLGEHKSSLRGGYHPSAHLQRSWNNYGESAFEFNHLKKCDESKLDDLETHFIALYDSTNPEKGYNIEYGGNKQKHMPEETRKKLSDANKGKNSAMYGLTGEMHPMYGKHLSLESRMKMSKSLNNTTGYFRVIKIKDNHSKQGFYYRYQYWKNNKRKVITSKSIKNLEEKVKAKGLEWIKLEELECEI